MPAWGSRRPSSGQRKHHNAEHWPKDWNIIEQEYFLVLDLGRPGRNSGRPDACGDEDYLRPDPDVSSRRPLP